MTHPLLAGLNPEQARAVTTTEGPLLVLAGAGSGKTRVLTHRLAYLVEKGVAPWNLLAVTFTNKAAGEMRHRVDELIGPPAARIHLSTFHSFCVHVLRRDIGRLGYSPRFTIYDTGDQKQLLKRLIQQERVDASKWTPAKVLRLIDQAKNKGIGPAEYRDAMNCPAGDPTPRLYPLYEQQLKALNAVDFNDLVNLTVRLWSQHADVLAAWRHRFRYIMVDEYQDTNRSQFQLIQLLGGGHRNVMVVGDDDQSIYAFRGADLRNILDFNQHFPDPTIVRLEQNYRSSGNVLAIANAVVQNNHGRMEKTLRTDRDPGEPVRMLVGSDEKDEAQRVVDTIRSLVSQGSRYGDIAVIYRTNAASRAFEEALVRAEIPHALVGSVKFYERREVRDMVAYLKLLLNPADDVAFERAVTMPRRGVGDQAMASLREFANAEGVPLLAAARRWPEAKGRAKKGLTDFAALIARMTEAVSTLPPSELVTRLATESGYLEMLRAEGTDEARARIENIEELARALAAADPPPPTEDGKAAPDIDAMQLLQGFLDRASLSSQADELPDEDGRGRVTLLTAHLAKGLECKVVFVAGIVQGGFPHFMAQDSEEEIEEERRLVYVAFTRAMDRLYLTRPQRRFNPHSRVFEPTELSRFLGEISPRLIDWGASHPAATDRADRLRRLGFAPSQARLVTATTSRADEEVEAVQPDGTYRTRTPETAEDLDPGTRVLHPTMGAGRVTSRSGPPNNLKVVVVFDSGSRKTLLVRHARLEILEE
jgi:DNA helicase II / ATP-dependent DNA helicase PcrA